MAAEDAGAVTELLPWLSFTILFAIIAGFAFLFTAGSMSDGGGSGSGND
jgi:hypothetical protein